MTNKQVISIGIFIFLFLFLWNTVGEIWGWRKGAELAKEISCEYNLKSIWILSQRYSRLYKVSFPPPFQAVKEYIEKRQSILLTKKISEYLGLGKLEGAYWTFDAILVCSKDPKYLLKMAKMSQDLPYEPSYQWCPDRRTLAYCPYCGLAVLLDGKIEKRSLPKP